MSDGERLWPPSEDDGVHPVLRAMGYALRRHCGTSTHRPQTGVPHRVCGLLLEVHHPRFLYNHTASTVSEALLRHVVPYFGTPRCLLSDRGREFVGEIRGKLLRSLGIQRVLTSPYHPEGNAINERSHRTLNNMLRVRLLEGASSKAWVEKVPGIMLALNAMSHEPHGFSASMVTTGREPTLPPDVQQDAHTSPSVDDPADYVEVITQQLQLTHQQMASPSPPAFANPYQEGSLIYTMTTPPERSNKLTPRWKGPFRVRRIPNEYQVVYEDGAMWWTVYVKHTKPAKFTAPDIPGICTPS